MKVNNENRLNWKLLKSLLDEVGISGQEGKIQKIIADNRNPDLYDANYEGLGNLVLRSKSSKKKRIAICSHSDEVGFFITKINKDGTANVVPMGGILSHNVLGSQFRFISTNNKTFIGVLKQPSTHEIRALLFARRRPRRNLESTSGELVNTTYIPKNITINFGFTGKEQAEKNGIRVGCQGTFSTKSQKLPGKKILGKALDNRVGTYINLMSSLSKNENSHYAIDHIFGVREEIGAVNTSRVFKDTKYECAIVLDVSPSREADNMGFVGKGTLKRIIDARHISRQVVLRQYEELAKKYNIKTQDYVSLGGTDAGAINTTNSGIPVIQVNLVAHNLHTANSMCSIDDILETQKMVDALILDVNRKWFNIY